MFFKKIALVVVAYLLLANFVAAMDQGILFAHLQGHEAPISSLTTLTLPNNQKYILSGSCDHTIRMWDWNTKECVYIFEGHTDTIVSVKVILEDKGGIIISGSADMTIKLWDPTTGDCLATLSGHSSPIICAELIDDNYFASIAKNGQVIIWNLAENRSEKTFFHDEYSEQIASNYYITFLGNDIFASASEESIKLWDIRNEPNCLDTFYIESKICGLKNIGNREHLHFLIPTVSYDGVIKLCKVWDWEDKEMVFSCPMQQDLAPSKPSIVILSDTTALVTFGNTLSIMYNYRNNTIELHTVHDFPIQCLTILDDYIIYGSPTNCDVMVSCKPVLK